MYPEVNNSGYGCFGVLHCKKLNIIPINAAKVGGYILAKNAAQEGSYSIIQINAVSARYNSQKMLPR